jgi:hypothetical protein
MQILESDSQIRQIILDSIKDHIETALNMSMAPISSEIKALVASSLRAEPEYQSLISGTLRIEFGIPDTNVVDRIIEMMTDTLLIIKNPIKVNNFGLSGGFELSMIKSDDINGIINTDPAIVTDSQKGYRLPWLEWLLFQSNQPIIRNYEVKIGPNSNSRTGMGIMVESNKNWRVPPEFAGSIKNNWTTRAISRIDSQLPKIFENNILKNI